MSALTYAETAWGFAAGVTVIGQLPSFDPRYNSSYSIMIIVVTGLGILISRSVDGIVRYKRGMAQASDDKIGLLVEQVRLLRERIEAGEKLAVVSPED